MAATFQAQHLGTSLLSSTRPRPCSAPRCTAAAAGAPRWAQRRAPVQQPSGRRGALRRGLVVATAEVLGGQQLSLALPTRDVQAALELTALRRKRGGTAILVLDVAPGSEAYAAGIRPGQQVLAISDPVRVTEVWDLNGLASLKYVKQAIEGRGPDSINLKLSAEPIPEWRAAVEAAQRAAEAAGATPGRQPSAAELQAEIERMQEATVQAKQAERDRKLEARRSYETELEAAKDSKPLFAAVFFGLFVGLPLTIVLAAYSTGYMDSFSAGRTF